jgi:anthranilate/para-aminobenzoate synthase component II
VNKVRILLIDNYDSFTYNLVQAFAARGAQVLVHRNDLIGKDQAVAIEPTHLVISPGPGRPGDAGCSLEMMLFRWRYRARGTTDARQDFAGQA